MSGCRRKVEHLSETVARNAATLHHMLAPECPGLEHYPCGDHWHIGHAARGGGDLCRERHADYSQGVKRGTGTLRQ